ncbi:methyltransferase, TIGR04325 family, partial [bacterium]|nr:methyltransferase, TIGR04325 family [bacterium]
ELNVIDFGGSLGSTYFQNREFLQALARIRWNIVEQSHFVKTGRKYFEDQRLKFYHDIESVLKETSPKTILFSSVIQYLENPYELLRKIKSHGFEYIIFDRTPFVQNGNDMLTVQIVPEEIYAASYPCWFFGKSKFYSFFCDKYKFITQFTSSDCANIPSSFEGCIFKKR